MKESSAQRQTEGCGHKYLSLPIIKYDSQSSNMHPKDLLIKDFTYSLPEDRIAKFPLEERDASRLLIYRERKITEDIYRNISAYIPDNSLLVFNNSKVVEARVLFQKSTGGVIELFCLEPGEEYADISTAMMQKGSVRWQCLVGGASKWKHGLVLRKDITYKHEKFQVSAEYIEKKQGCFVIEFSWEPSHLGFAEVLHAAGAIPLPPYIKREVITSDAERYQTVYANEAGSVAAPTAGLHFTPRIFNDLAARKIKTAFVTLHVGAGTFKPVKSETLAGHDMHAEFIDVSRTTIEQILQSIDNIIAVGTTSLRTLESLYWLGVQATNGNVTDNISQWTAYENESSLPAAAALQALLKWMDEQGTSRLMARTQILIAPGYKIRMANALITNFHQPQSTLLLLIAALIGDDWKKIYDYALGNGFRFLSYGDGCFLSISPWK